jgi:SAM-dependent methyltransferase
MSMEIARRGADVIAIEPGTSWCKITAKRLATTGSGSAIQAVGEYLPFADNSFDQIVSLQVLEHVHDPQSVIREAFRVLRPGGTFYIVYENYLSFWEPHYRVRWLPLLPKAIGSIYLRLLGRDPTFLKESITYTTLFAVRRHFAGAGFSCQRRAGFLRSLQDPAKPGARWRIWRTVAAGLGTSTSLRGVMMLDGCRRTFQTSITEVMLKPARTD